MRAGGSSALSTLRRPTTRDAPGWLWRFSVTWDVEGVSARSGEGCLRLIRQFNANVRIVSPVHTCARLWLVGLEYIEVRDVDRRVSGYSFLQSSFCSSAHFADAPSCRECVSRDSWMPCIHQAKVSDWTVGYQISTFWCGSHRGRGASPMMLSWKKRSHMWRTSKGFFARRWSCFAGTIERTLPKTGRRSSRKYVRTGGGPDYEISQVPKGRAIR